MFTLFCLFINGVLNDSFKQLNRVEWFVSDELKMTWTEVTAPWFEILSQHLPGEAEENNKTLESG
jgi:hypothetical protein